MLLLNNHKKMWNWFISENINQRITLDFFLHGYGNFNLKCDHLVLNCLWLVRSCWNMNLTWISCRWWPCYGYVRLCLTLIVLLSIILKIYVGYNMFSMALKQILSHVDMLSTYRSNTNRANFDLYKEYQWVLPLCN